MPAIAPNVSTAAAATEIGRRSSWRRAGGITDATSHETFEILGTDQYSSRLAVACHDHAVVLGLAAVDELRLLHDRLELVRVGRVEHQPLRALLDLVDALLRLVSHRAGGVLTRLLGELEGVVDERERRLALIEERRVALLRPALGRDLPADRSLTTFSSNGADQIPAFRRLRAGRTRPLVRIGAPARKDP